MTMGESADTRGWGPGWPANRSKDMVRVTAGDVTVIVHKVIAPVIGHLLDKTLEGGYQLKAGECWGYANREIRNSSPKRPSNHSWGLAVDLNSLTNPMQSPLRTDMPSWMTNLWKSFGFRWGGDYQGRKDAMHFEFMGTPADAARLAAQLDHREEEAMAIVVTRPQGGYMVVQPDGGVFAAPPAPYCGSIPDRHIKLTMPVVGAAWTESGQGYWLVSKDGAVYAFGDAQYLGGFNTEPVSTRGGRYAVGMSRTGTRAYRIVTFDPSGDTSRYDAYEYTA
jgi:hypothetical protein